MIYVSQIIMLYTLNLYSAVFQLYFNKTGRKKNIIKGRLKYICKVRQRKDLGYLNMLVIRRLK